MLVLLFCFSNILQGDHFCTKQITFQKVSGKSVTPDQALHYPAIVISFYNRFSAKFFFNSAAMPYWNKHFSQDTKLREHSASESWLFCFCFETKVLPTFWLCSKDWIALDRKKIFIWLDFSLETKLADLEI